MVLGVASATGQASTPCACLAASAATDIQTVSTASVRKFANCKPKRRTGDASAQATLGKAHQEGNGVTQNDALALKWSRKAAEQGDSDAENTLGVMYRMGEGVARQRRGGSLVPQVRETRRSEGDV